jgi:hypothetical protein
VKVADFDRDGDNDIFVGGRAKAFQYGMPVNSHVLRNNGKGFFENATLDVAPGLVNIGMITDASWFDYDKDGFEDLVVVGDWMPIRIFRNQKGVTLTDVTKLVGLQNTAGLWNCVEVADLDGDGDLDLVAGNEGLNTRLKASPGKPLSMYVDDFDGNGKLEQIIAVFNGDRSFPLVMRSDLVDQLPALKKKYLKHHDYANQSVEQVFGVTRLAEALRLNVNSTASIALINDHGKFQPRELPYEVQLSQIHAVSVTDFNQDKIPDLIVGGNFYWSKPEIGINDASFGSILLGKGDGTYKSMTMQESGLCVRGEIRDIQSFHIGRNTYFLATRTNDFPVLLKTNIK